MDFVLALVGWLFFGAVVAIIGYIVGYGRGFDACAKRIEVARATGFRGTSVVDQIAQHRPPLHTEGAQRTIAEIAALHGVIDEPEPVRRKPDYTGEERRSPEKLAPGERDDRD